MKAGFNTDLRIQGLPQPSWAPNTMPLGTCIQNDLKARLIVSGNHQMITLDLSRNDAEALLHHCKVFKPQSGDQRHDSRLEDALAELAEAIEAHFAEDSRT